MAEEKNKVGRPSITDEEKELILQKLEPLLKSGVGIQKALLEAQIPSSTFYKLMDEDEEFMERINTYRQYLSVVTNNAIFKHLQQITDKQKGDEIKGIKPQALSKEDIDFLKWYALNSVHCKDEFGNRQNINMAFDPEQEIQKVKRLIEENTTKELEHLD
jgi:hypothetical protein